MQYVSNRWGGSEFSGESSYDSRFTSSSGRVRFFVAAGDAGLPAEHPSASPNVISVGGTTLHLNPDGTLNSETGRSSGGDGCSSYETANTSEEVLSGPLCGAARGTPDVALDADPASGVPVMTPPATRARKGGSRWGAISASSPMWAARSADLGTVVDSAYVNGNNVTYRDITVGNNGAPCLNGYDLCSGRGSGVG